MTELLQAGPPLGERETTTTPEHLNEGDLEWLNKLSSRVLTIDDLESYNRVASVGAKHLTDDIDPDTVNEVMYAREAFYEGLLGWDEESHALHGSYDNLQSTKERLMPLDTAVSTLRAMNELDLPAQKIIGSLPAALGLSEANIRGRVALFEELDLPAQKIIGSLPSALGLSEANIRTVFGTLKRYGYSLSTESIEHNRSLLSRLLIIPNETLLVFMAQCGKDLPSLDELMGRLAAFRRSDPRLQSRPGRIELYRDVYPELVDLVGCMAVRQARQNGVDTWSHLEGEVIPVESLRQKPDSAAWIAPEQ